MLMMNEELRTIMTKDPIIAHPNDTIADAQAKMKRKRVQQMPVVDDGNHLVGIVTVFDFWKHREQTAGTVRDIMSTDVVKLSPKDKVGTAAELFMDKRFKTFPVVNLRNELKGVITAFDVIRYSYRKEYPEPILYKDVVLAS